ncbi:MAG: hypothetical protein QOE63_1311, partial [Acidimicrobiaceae bacterium]
RDPLWLWVAFGLPGVLAVLTSPGEGDLLATGLVLLGYVWWTQDDRRWPAIVAFSLAALTRETTLLVPAALALDELVRHRRIILRLAIPFATYAAWVAIVRARVGFLPSDGGGDNFTLPFVGLADSVPHWGTPEIASVVLLGVLVIVAWSRLPAIGRLVVALYLALFTVLAVYAAAFWWAFGRILLPAYVIAMVELLPRLRRAEPASAELAHQPAP